MSARILIAEPMDFSPTAVAIIQQAGQVDLCPTSGPDLAAAFRDYDVVWFRLAHRIDARMLAQAERCRILATPVTGLDHIDLDACQARGIQVLSLRGEVDFLREVRATAELALALMLALLRRVPAAAASVGAGVWDRDLFRGRELYGKTAGVVGLGRLGSIVAGYLRAFGMRVVAYDPRPDFPAALAERLPTLADLLAVSDLVTLHVPYNRETRHLLGPGEFAAMKAGSVLINTSRGGMIDEAALLAALASGRLSGAALDVLAGEPDIAPDHPVLAYARTHDNLLVVPHIGGNTVESFEKTEIFLANKVVAALSAGGRSR